MNREVYRYVINQKIAMHEIEATLDLAVVAVESLHGATCVRLDARYSTDDAKHACVIDTATIVGADLNRIFTGYLRQEFGDDSFKVERINSMPASPHMAVS